MVVLVKRLGFYLTASLLFVSAMLLAFTVFYYYVEGPANPNINTWLDAFYFTVITTRTIGFGDISPQTTSGKLGTILNALLPATVFLGASLLVLEQFFKHLEGKWKAQLLMLHQHHTVIVAGEDLLPSIIREHESIGHDFVVVGQQPFAELSETLQELLNDSNYLSGNPQEDITLKRAGIERAGHILIATNDDARNIFVHVTAKGLNPGITSVVQVNHLHNEAKFQAVGVELLLPMHRILGRMFARAAVAPVSHQFLIDLNTHSVDPFLEETASTAADEGIEVLQHYPDAVAVHRGERYFYRLRGVRLRQGDIILRIHEQYDGNRPEDV